MLRRRPRGDDGVSALELSIIAPSLLLLIFFVIQGALYLYGRSVAEQAAREGVSRLRLEQTPDDYNVDRAGIEGEVTRFARGIGSGALENPRVSSVYDDQHGTVTVTVTGTAISLIGISFDITETATGHIERFQNAP